MHYQECLLFYSFNSFISCVVLVFLQYCVCLHVCLLYLLLMCVIKIIIITFHFAEIRLCEVCIMIVNKRYVSEWVERVKVLS